MKKRLEKAFTFLICLLIVTVTALLGSMFTELSAWYYSVRPAITPPSWVFPIAWNVIFLLLAFSLYFSWTGVRNSREEKKVLLAFGVNLLLNILWTLLYFKLKSPILSFIEILLLLASIVWIIRVTSKISKLAAWLNLPYLLWVMFAAIINLLSI